MPVFTVSVTDKEYGTGVHYDKARALAKEAGYEKPFVCFEGADQNAILSVARKLDLVARIVAIDMTDGLVHSVRCDAGDIIVVCYDDSDTVVSSDSATEIPVEIDGTVKRRTHVQTADIDPALKSVRVRLET